MCGHVVVVVGKGQEGIGQHKASCWSVWQKSAQTKTTRTAAEEKNNTQDSNVVPHRSTNWAR